MRLIYDIAVLGMGFHHPRAETGVFKVIENLAQELVKARAISSFSSAMSIGSYFECRDYLQTNSTLEYIPLDKPGASEEVLNVYQYLHVRTHIKKSAPPCIRGINRLANGVANRILVRKTINRDVLALAEIYHSPFYSPPEQIKMGLRKLKRVQFQRKRYWE